MSQKLKPLQLVLDDEILDLNAQNVRRRVTDGLFADFKRGYYGVLVKLRWLIKNGEFLSFMLLFLQHQTFRRILDLFMVDDRCKKMRRLYFHKIHDNKMLEPVARKQYFWDTWSKELTPLEFCPEDIATENIHLFTFSSYDLAHSYVFEFGVEGCLQPFRENYFLKASNRNALFRQLPRDFSDFLFHLPAIRLVSDMRKCDCPSDDESEGKEKKKKKHEC